MCVKERNGEELGGREGMRDRCGTLVVLPRVYEDVNQSGRSFFHLFFFLLVAWSYSVNSVNLKSY